MADGVKVIANNKKAYFDYFILDKYETGIELFGTEVKSIRLGQCSIKESWIRIERGEPILWECTSIPMRREISLIRIHFE